MKGVGCVRVFLWPKKVQHIENYENKRFYQVNAFFVPYHCLSVSAAIARLTQNLQ